MTASLWNRYCTYLVSDADLGLTLDISRMRFPDGFFETMEPAMQQAFAAMAQLEQGAIANPDENRMVGHYWLRTPELAPTAEIAQSLKSGVDAIVAFAHKIIAEKKFRHILHIGIGGSALGPQFVAQALGEANQPLSISFLDNTDPDGFDRVLAELSGKLHETLVTVVSKSGSTPEPSNAMLEAKAAFQMAGIPFAAHAVAITMPGSKLDQLAIAEKWLARFPMQDWVGGRTSVMSAVGLVPAALVGIDVRAFLDGAAAMDRLTRQTTTRQNPAAVLALMWYFAGDGKGSKDMVILPYKDRLALFSKYLQQLVMESLGKELDRTGAVVNQGIAVYGNKGSTDQHAYIQQLRDGVANFFATFIQVRKDRAGLSIAVEPGITSGDYLLGFLLGTRQALYENGRDSITIAIDELTPRTLGALIALYERAVGLYAELVNINAYHQPGVEAGKKAASAILGLKAKVLSALRQTTGGLTAEAVANQLGLSQEVETIYQILDHFAVNHASGVVRIQGGDPLSTLFAVRG